MRIISWNTNGLRSTIKNGDFLTLFKKYKPDIVCLQETKCEKEQIPKEYLSFDGYEGYFSASQMRKGYSGTAIYTKIKPKKVEYGIGIKECDQEGRIVICYFDDFVLLNTYFPNGGSGPDRLEYKLKFYDAYLDFCKKLTKKGHNVIFCGDINTAHSEVDLARPKANEKNTGFLPIERAWIDKVIKNDFIDIHRTLYPKTIDVYTYWDQKTAARERNVGWRIDYFFVNKGYFDKVKDMKTENEYTGSDHCPIMLDLK